MKIAEIELWHVSVPLKHTLWPTWIPGYPQTHNLFTLIKLITDEGIEGYSAGTAMGKEREGLGDLLGACLIGADPTDIDRVPDWDLKRAAEFAAACHVNVLIWLEEPLDSRDCDGNAALKKISKIKISGAEINYGWDEIKIMIEKDCFHIYQPDATFAGGIRQCMQVIRSCNEKGREYSPHTSSNGIGFYVNGNLVLADRENTLPLEYPLEEPSWIPEFREGVIDPILPDKNALLAPFTRPGLGFEINPSMLKKYGKRFFRLTETGLKFKVIREKGLPAALALKKRKKAQ